MGIVWKLKGNLFKMWRPWKLIFPVVRTTTGRSSQRREFINNGESLEIDILSSQNYNWSKLSEEGTFKNVTSLEIDIPSS